MVAKTNARLALRELQGPVVYASPQVQQVSIPKSRDDAQDLVYKLGCGCPLSQWVFDDRQFGYDSIEPAEVNCTSGQPPLADLHRTSGAKIDVTTRSFRWASILASALLAGLAGCTPNQNPEKVEV